MAAHAMPTPMVVISKAVFVSQYSIENKPTPPAANANAYTFLLPNLLASGVIANAKSAAEMFLVAPITPVQFLASLNASEVKSVVAHPHTLLAIACVVYVHISMRANHEKNCVTESCNITLGTFFNNETKLGDFAAPVSMALYLAYNAGGYSFVFKAVQSTLNNKTEPPM